MVTYAVYGYILVVCAWYPTWLVQSDESLTKRNSSPNGEQFPDKEKNHTDQKGSQIGEKRLVAHTDIRESKMDFLV